MALSDYVYSSGTISVTNGQKAFTGAGTAWLLRGAIGAITIIGSTISIVASLSAENVGQFVDNYTGPTQANVPYRMWLVTAEAATNLANHTRLAQIIASIDTAQPESGILSALAGLAAGGDKLPYFTGANTMALVDFKLWARSLFGLTMAANKLPYGTGADTMGLTDFPEWARLFVGAASLNAGLPPRLQANGQLVTNLNTIAASGFYIHAPGATGQPFAGYGNVLHQQFDNTVVQIWNTASGALSYERRFHAGPWTPWTDTTCAGGANWIRRGSLIIQWGSTVGITAGGGRLEWRAGIRCNSPICLSCRSFASGISDRSALRHHRCGCSGWRGLSD